MGWRKRSFSRPSTVATLIIKLQPESFMPVFSSKALDPGSGWKIPAKWHGTGACHGVLSHKPGTKDGIHSLIGSVVPPQAKAEAAKAKAKAKAQAEATALLVASRAKGQYSTPPLCK